MTSIVLDPPLLLKVSSLFPPERVFSISWEFFLDVRSWDRDVVCVQIVKLFEANF